MFSFPTVEPGRYTLTGERAGYAKQAYGARSNASVGSVLALTAGQEMKDLIFKLVPNAVISGKVLDEDGDPLQNAAVIAVRPGYQRGRKQLAEAGEAMVGANGEYSISLTAGRYLLAAVSMASMVAGINGASSKPPSDQPEPAYATVFYPQSPDELGAIPVDAAAGADLRGMDFHMSKVKTFRVRGKLTEKVSFVMLMPKVPSATTAPRMVRPQPDDTFEFIGVTPGQWVLRAASEGAASASVDVITVDDHHLNGLVVSLTPARDLTGTVTVDSKDPVNLKEVQIRLEGQLAKNSGQATPAEDGKFTVKTLLPDRYRVLISSAPGDTYPKSIRYGTEEVLST